MPKTFKVTVDAGNVHQILSPPLFEIVSVPLLFHANILTPPEQRLERFHSNVIPYTKRPLILK